MNVGTGGWNERKACDGRREGRRDGIKEHFGEGTGKLAGRNTNGYEGACDPNHGSWGSKGVTKVAVVGEVVLVEVKMFAESHGAGEGTRGDPVWDSVKCKPLSDSGRSVVLIGSVFGALCVQCVGDTTDSIVPYHVVVGGRVDSGVCVAWMFEEDTPMDCGGWSRHEERGVGDGHRMNRSEGVVSSDENNAKTDTGLWQVSS